MSSDANTFKRLPDHELSDNLQRSPMLSPPENIPLKRLRRAIALTVLAPLLVGAFGACGDDSTLTQDATTTNTVVSGSLYALTGSSPELPAGYAASSNAFVRPLVGQFSGVVNFELAVDIRDDGKVLLIPARALVPFAPAPSSGAPSIALLKSGQAFDILTRAPNGEGYVADSVQVASAGDTFLLKVVSSGCVYGEPLYGKLVIDSVIVSQRRMVVRAMTNLNCGGYRSLVSGSIPKD